MMRAAGEEEEYSWTSLDHFGHWGTVTAPAHSPHCVPFEDGGKYQIDDIIPGFNMPKHS